MEENNLKRKTISGAWWSFAENILKYGISFVVGIVLARLLSPIEYGLVGIISIFIALFNSFVDCGFSTALIRNNKAGDLEYSTAFYANLMISIFMFALLELSAPIIARFFDNELLCPMTRVMGFVIIINALSLVQKTKLTQRLDFKTQTKVTIISSITSGVIGITMAYYGCGVWSLVVQQICNQTLSTLLLWILNRWVPKLLFSKHVFVDMLSFGWRLLAIGLINTLWNEIYLIVIGKCYKPATLGQFTRAKQFSDIFSSNLVSVVQRVSLPSLSKVQDDEDILRCNYKKSIRLTTFISSLMLFNLAAMSKPLVLTLLGEKWMVATTFLPLLCLTMVLYPIGVINLNMMALLGRSDLCLKVEIYKKIIQIIPILLGIFIGIYWMLLGSIITSIIAYLFNSKYSGILIGYSVKDQIIDILPIISIAIIDSLFVYFLSFVPLLPLFTLILQVLCSFVIVILLCRLFEITEFQTLLSIIQRNKK